MEKYFPVFQKRLLHLFFGSCYFKKCLPYKIFLTHNTKYDPNIVNNYVLDIPDINKFLIC